MATKTIPARPFPFVLREGEVAILVIDFQRDFIEPGGFGESLGNDVSILSKIVPTAKAVLDLCRSLGIPVVHTKEAHKPDLSDCPKAKRTRGNPPRRIGDQGSMGRLLIDGEPGTDFIPEMAPLDGEIVIVKPGKGAFYDTNLLDILQKMDISQLIFIGVTTEVCVQTTMREANDRGFDCLLIRNATASYFPKFKEAFIAMITAQGAIVGWETTFEELQTNLTA